MAQHNFFGLDNFLFVLATTSYCDYTNLPYYLDKQIYFFETIIVVCVFWNCITLLCQLHKKELLVLFWLGDVWGDVGILRGFKVGAPPVADDVLYHPFLHNTVLSSQRLQSQLSNSSPKCISASPKERNPTETKPNFNDKIKDKNNAF